jgi:hypothetical protein
VLLGKKGNTASDTDGFSSSAMCLNDTLTCAVLLHVQLKEGRRGLATNEGVVPPQHEMARQPHV